MRARQQLFFVILVIAALCTYLSPGRSASRLLSMPECRTPIAIGIEFTMGGVVISAKLSNSTSTPLLMQPGNKQYKQAMRNLYRLSRSAAETREVPAGYESLSSRAPWDQLLRHPRNAWKDWFEVHILRKPLYFEGRSDLWFPYYHADKDVAALKHIISLTKGRAGALLKASYGLDFTHCSPYALMAVPSFMIDPIQPPFPRATTDIWIPVHRYWERALLHKFSRAVVEAGYNRAPYFDEEYVSVESQRADPARLVWAATPLVSCAEPLEGCVDKRCSHPRRLNRAECCSLPGSIIIHADLSAELLYLSIEGVRGCETDFSYWAPWSVHLNLGLSKGKPTNSAPGWERDLQSVIDDFATELKKRAGATGSNVTSPRLVPTGQSWDDLRLKALLAASTSLGINLVETTEEQRLYSASLGAAEERWHKMQIDEIWD